jgi:3-oxoacyl-[acyl-carrier protein] reductase
VSRFDRANKGTGEDDLPLLDAIAILRQAVGEPSDATSRLVEHAGALRAAVAGWAKSLAGETAADGITVNLLLAGRLATERTNVLDRLDAGTRGIDISRVAQESQAEIPIGRYGTPDEFGAVAAFLASEHASYVTGTAIPIDGGLSHAII